MITMMMTTMAMGCPGVWIKTEGRVRQLAKQCTVNCTELYFGEHYQWTAVQLDSVHTSKLHIVMHHKLHGNELLYSAIVEIWVWSKNIVVFEVYWSIFFSLSESETKRHVLTILMQCMVHCTAITFCALFLTGVRQQRAGSVAKICNQCTQYFVHFKSRRVSA